MEKYGQYRDKGSGIAPFFPIPIAPSGIYLPLHVFLFCVRVPLLFAFTLTYTVLFSWLPVNSFVKKGALWTILGIPGIWWVDLQIDGVKRGSLARHQDRLPKPGSVIASSFTSPIDCLYLAAIFDPLFTASYPNTRLVEPISLLTAIFRALMGPKLKPSSNTRLVSLGTLLKDNPDSSIVVLPECTTSNGRAILPFSPCLLTTPAKTKIFPVNLRYTPADITTPIPGSVLTFLWNLCSKPTHCIRVRIAEYTFNTSASEGATLGRTTQATYLDDVQMESISSADTLVSNGETGGPENLTFEERKVLDTVAEDLARLGRVKRVGLGVKEKIDFVKAWGKTRTVY